MSGQTISSLSDIPLGVYVRVRELRHSGRVSRRLRELGLREESIVRCIQRAYGNLICEVDSSRVGITLHVAREIIVMRQEG